MIALILVGVLVATFYKPVTLAYHHRSGDIENAPTVSHALPMEAPVAPAPPPIVTPKPNLTIKKRPAISSMEILHNEGHIGELNIDKAHIYTKPGAKAEIVHNTGEIKKATINNSGISTSSEREPKPDPEK